MELGIFTTQHVYHIVRRRLAVEENKDIINKYLSIAQISCSLILTSRKLCSLRPAHPNLASNTLVT